MRLIGLPRWIKRAAAPANPSTDEMLLYFLNDGKLYSLDNAGIQTQIGAPIVPVSDAEPSGSHPDGLLWWDSDDNSDPGFALTTHTHTKADITDLGTLGTASTRDVPSSGNASSTQVVLGSDTRMSDARTPLAHSHVKADISDLGTIGTAAAKNVPASGNAASSEVVLGNDTRLSDARTPLTHTHGVADLTATGTKDSTTFLRGDNVWAVPPGGGGAAPTIIEVNAATTTNITLSGTQFIDGRSCGVGDLVLVKDQSTFAQNGVYVVASGAWTRATTADTAAELALLTVRVGAGGNTWPGELFMLYGWTSASTVGTTAQWWISVDSSEETVADFGTTSGTITMDLSRGVRNYTITPNGTVSPAFTNVPAGVAVTVTLLCRIPSTASTVNLPANGTWLGSAPTFATGKDVLVTFYTVDAGSNWYCSAVVEV